LTKALRLPSVVVAGLEMLAVFTLTCFAWIFFRAQTFADARRIIEIIFEFRDLKLHMSEQLIAIAKTGLVASVVFAVDALSARETIRDWYLSRPALRFAGALLLVWALVLIGTFEGSSFLYIQF
jgi:alginate O-acetyltransferase complex protein AlgI